MLDLILLKLVLFIILNLINEGKSKDSIFMMGNTMIDSLVKFESKFNYSALKLNFLLLQNSKLRKMHSI